MAKIPNTAPAEATIYDIAKLAGVNASTVSRALGNQDRVSAKTRKLVEDAAEQLNYKVNPMARALQTGRTDMVGLIVTDLTNPSYFDIIRGAQSEAAARGLTLVLAESSDSSTTEAAAAQRMQSACDGIILASPRITDPEIRAINRMRPVALINRCVDGVDSIVPDIEAGIGEAVRHLSSNGHRQIAFLAGPKQSWISARPWHSLRSTCQWAGLEAQLIGTIAPTTEGGRRAARDVMAAGATAAVCYNDVLAIGLMHELQSAGLNIPDDFSVVGFDNIFGSDFTTPALTTIASPFSACGAAALDLLLAALPSDRSNSRQLTPVSRALLRTTLLEVLDDGLVIARGVIEDLASDQGIVRLKLSYGRGERTYRREDGWQVRTIRRNREPGRSG